MKYKANLIKKLLKTSHSNLFRSKKLLQKKIDATGNFEPNLNLNQQISNLMADKFKP